LIHNTFVYLFCWLPLPSKILLGIIIWFWLFDYDKNFKKHENIRFYFKQFYKINMTNKMRINKSNIHFYEPESLKNSCSLTLTHHLSRSQVENRCLISLKYSFFNCNITRFDQTYNCCLFDRLFLKKPEHLFHDKGPFKYNVTLF